MSTHPPRPLHLVTNSITSTPTVDTFPLSSPISRFQHTERLSMTASASFSNSSLTMGGFDTTMRTKTTRRKSSIGYLPQDSIGSPYRGSLTRRNSFGTPNPTSLASQGHVKSRPRPLSTTSPKLKVDTSSGSPARVRQPITLMERCGRALFSIELDLESVQQECRFSAARGTKGVKVSRASVTA